MDSEQERSFQDGTGANRQQHGRPQHNSHLEDKESNTLMNLSGYWHSEDQVRVGEYERREFEEKKKFAGKVNKIAKMVVRMVALEGMQPVGTEAFSKEGDNIQCGLEDMRLEEMKESNGQLEYFWIIVIMCNHQHFPCSSDLLWPIKLSNVLN